MIERHPKPVIAAVNGYAWRRETSCTWCVT